MRAPTGRRSDRAVPRAAPTSRRRWSRTSLIGLVLVLTALFSIDCLNLIQSEAWADLSQAPHMAAVSRTSDSGSRPTPKIGTDARTAVVVAVVVILLAGIVWDFAGSLVLVHASGARRRERERAPPAAPVRPGSS